VRARAALAVELDGRGLSVVRRLRSAAPLTLVPARDPRRALVRLVNSAAAPLAGDDLELTVRVGPGARLSLAGVAATLALPGHGREPSRFTVHIELADNAACDYLPGPTVITGRAWHESHLCADLGLGATLRCREILVLGRAGEAPGRLATAVHIVRDARPLLRQHLTIGDPALDASPAHLAGHRVLATEIRIDDRRSPAAGGEWWSRTPLPAGGSLTTVLAGDAVTALHGLELAAHS
jgi:urease accessory protein